jgi:hypothetical protein
MSSAETTTVVTPLSPLVTEPPVPEHDSKATLLEMEDVAHGMMPEQDSEALLLGMEDMVQDMVPEEDFQAMLLEMEDMVQDMSNMLLDAASMQETKVLQPNTPQALLIPP